MGPTHAPTPTPATEAAQRPSGPAGPTADDAAPPWAWTCTAPRCHTVTGDGTTARVHSLNPGHVLDWLPVGSVPCER